MAFAYISFVDDGVKRIVKTSSIKKFNPNEVDFSKKYKVLYDEDQHYYRAYIICIGDSEHEVTQTAESKRIRLPPSRYDNDSEITETEEVNASTSVRKKNVIQKQNTLSNKSYNSLMAEISSNNLNASDKDESIIQALQVENKALKEQLQLLTYKHEEVLELNVKLQNEMLSSWNEMKLTLNVLKEKPVVSEVNMQDKPVGYTLDDRIHLGRNVWLPVQIYNSIDVRSKSDGAFVRALACAVFGSNTLALSSVTGQKCNRTKGEAALSLDPTKLIAMHDIVRYRLLQNGMDLEKAQLYCNKKVDSIIASKISDLKRAPRTTRKNDSEESTVVDLQTEIELAHDLLINNP